MKIERLMKGKFSSNNWIAFYLKGEGNFYWCPSAIYKDCLFVFDVYNCIGKSENTKHDRMSRPLYELYSPLTKLIRNDK